MTCADFEDLILDRIDGCLSPAKTHLVETHLSACEACRSFLSAAVEMDRSIAHFAGRRELPVQFTSDILRRIDYSKSPPVRFLHPGVVWDLVGLAALAASGAFCVWHLVPNLLLGGGWLAATVILCGGAYIALADPEVP